MEIRKDKFLASLLAFGLIGAAAGCGGSSEEAEGTDTEMTTGGDTMAEPTDTTGMDDMGGGDMGGDTGGDMGDTGDTGGDMGGDDMGGGDIGPTPE